MHFHLPVRFARTSINCLLKALQGLGFGGEWAAGAVLMGEVIRDKYRGRAVGLVQTGWSVGWGTAALLYTLLSANLPEALTWRVMFWIGLAPAGAGVLDPALRGGAGDPAARRRGPVGLLHLFSALRPPYLSHDLAGGDDGYGRAGVELCAHDVPAAVSEDRAPSDFGRHRQLFDGADPGGVLWVSVRRVSGGRDRAEGDVPGVGHRYRSC